MTDSAGHRDADIRDVSIGQLLSDVSRDLSTLMRQEIELAKAETKAEVSKAAKGAGMLGGAGYAAHLFVLFLSFAAWWALAGLLGHIGWAALIVAAVWAAVAGTLFVVGRNTLKQVNPTPERTIETAREVPGALTGN